MRKGIIIEDAHGNVPEVFYLEDLPRLAYHLKTNVESGSKFKMSYHEFTEDECRLHAIAGKLEGGDGLTKEEEDLFFK